MKIKSLLAIAIVFLTGTLVGQDFKESDILGIWFNEDKDAKVEIYKENETGFLWGVGAGVKLGGLAVRLEWESLGTTNPESLSMITGGVAFGF